MSNNKKTDGDAERIIDSRLYASETKQSLMKSRGEIEIEDVADDEAERIISENTL